MTAELQIQSQTPTAPPVTSVQSGFLQRKCACGGPPGLTAECADCDKKKFTLQRSVLAAEPGTPTSENVPAIVHEVLGSPGQPLDRETRKFMEQHIGHDFGSVQTHSPTPQRATNGLTVGPANDQFEQEADQIAERLVQTSEHGSNQSAPSAGYDFSRVRIHTDQRSAQSARSVGALAYTVGQNIVFGSGQFAPATIQGRALLAHELTHVVQQSENLHRSTLQRSFGGFLRNIFINVPVFGFLLHFSQEELQGYLKQLDETGKIEDDDDSDNKAVVIAESWNKGERKFVLTARRKALLILEMLSAWVSDDDEQAILGLLERSDNPELKYIFGEGQVKHQKLLSELSSTRRQLYRFYQRRFPTAYPDPTIEEMERGGAAVTKPDLTKLAHAEPGGTTVQPGDEPPKTTNPYYSSVKRKETKRRTDLVTREEADSWVNEVYGQFLPEDKVKKAGEKKGFAAKNIPLNTDAGGSGDIFMDFLTNCVQFELDQMTRKQRQDQDERSKAQAKCEVEERSVAGFFDAARNEITVRADRESPSTRVHEVIHAYAESSVNGKLTRYAMEGLTEYLTRQVITRHKLIKNEKRLAISQSYGGPQDAILELSLIVGDAALARAHFQGDVESLSQAVGKDVFDRWLELMKEKDGWQEAVKVLRGRKTARKAKVQKRVASHPETSSVPPILDEVLRSSGQPLDVETRAFMEKRFGHDFSNVRVHTDTTAAESARAVNALAYTVGRHMVFEAGHYDPGTRSGRKLIAHELTHTIQQGGQEDSSVKEISQPSDRGEVQASMAAERIVSDTEPGEVASIDRNGINSHSAIFQDEPVRNTVQREVLENDPANAPPMSCPLPPNAVADYALNIQFDENKATLNPLEKEVLASFATEWNLSPVFTRPKVRVDGFASIEGNAAQNWPLSCARAEAVANELIAPSVGGKPGIPASSLNFFANGETDRFLPGLAPNRIAGIHAPGLSPPTSREPSVFKWSPKNMGNTDPANCCGLCPLKLGVDCDPPDFNNGIEFTVSIRDHSSSHSYDIKRIKEAKYHRRPEFPSGFPAPWLPMITWNKPAGTPDDARDDLDECLIPQASGSVHKVYSEDRPGFKPLGIPSSYDSYIQKINFVEFVRIRRPDGSTYDDPLKQNWHTKILVEKSKAGWSVNTAESEIDTGHLSSLDP